MADDDVQEFSKDNQPDPGTGTWYRSAEMVHATGPYADGAKVGGKRHKGAGFIVVHDAVENKNGKIEWVDAADFNERFIPATPADPIPRPQGPHFDASEASEEQATGYQMDEKKQGDDVAARTIANQTGA